MIAPMICVKMITRTHTMPRLRSKPHLDLSNLPDRHGCLGPLRGAIRCDADIEATTAPLRWHFQWAYAPPAEGTSPKAEVIHIG